MAKMENTYKMTDRDIRLMIQLRASNADVFTGRKNSAMRGWRAICKEMGIQRVVTAQQLKKKWHNMKNKYRVLKNPPVGMETQARSWRWFHLMDAAMNGRLAESANMAKDEEDNTTPATLHCKTEAASSPSQTPEDMGIHGDVLELSEPDEAEIRTESLAFVAEQDDMSFEYERNMMESPQQNQTAILYATLMPDGSFTTDRKPSSSSSSSYHGEMDEKLAELQREWQALERDQTGFDRELITLERDREMLKRDMATLDRDRELIKRDQAALDRDRVALDRDRAFLDRDRAFLDRDRVFLERAKEDLEKERALWRREKAILERKETAVDGHGADMTTEKEVVLHTRFYQRVMAADLDPDQLDTRQRLVCLLQKLVEKL